MLLDKTPLAGLSSIYHTCHADWIWISLNWWALDLFRWYSRNNKQCTVKEKQQANVHDDTWLKVLLLLVLLEIRCHSETFQLFFLIVVKQLCRMTLFLSHRMNDTLSTHLAHFKMFCMLVLHNFIMASPARNVCYCHVTLTHTCTATQTDLKASNRRSQMICDVNCLIISLYILRQTRH